MTDIDIKEIKTEKELKAILAEDGMRKEDKIVENIYNMT